MSLVHGLSTPSTSLAIPHTQSTAPVLEFRCLFTADLKRKQKRWQDGKLKFHTHNKRVMVYDEKANFVGDSHWREEFPLGEGDELNLERGGIMVEVGECVGKTEQDLTELVDKRIKDKESRAAAKAAKGTPVRASMVSMRMEGTPGLTPQHKPLNAMLTPSGHYRRAVMPTTSPFEDRQQLASGNVGGKENERPAKRQRLNETASKHGYAQNLMGATLSLSSSRPPSSAPIRYESLKLKSVPRPEPVDLTLDDDEEDSTSKSLGNVERSKEKHDKRDSKVHKRQRRSPPPKSTYASNLTGTSLNLSMPSIRKDISLPKPQPLKPSPPIELDNSSSEEKSGDDDHSQVEAQSTSKIVSKKTKPPKQNSIQRQNLEENTRAFKKAASKGNAVSKAPNNRGRAFHPTTDSEPESENDQGFEEVSTTSKPTKGKKISKRSLTSVHHSDEDVQVMKKARITKTKKDKRLSKQTSMPPSRPISPDFSENRLAVLKPSKSVSEPVNPSSAIVGAQSEVNVSSLRIKSKPTRRMMMHVDRSSTRTPSNSSSKVQATPKAKDHLKQTDNDIVMSQDTIQLNAFCQKQEAKLQARLAGKKHTNQEPLISSPASTDKGINHQTIDLLLSRKSMQLIRNDPARHSVPKPTSQENSLLSIADASLVPEHNLISSTASAVTTSDRNASSPARENTKVVSKPINKTNPLPAYDVTDAGSLIEQDSTIVSGKHDTGEISSSPALKAARKVPKEVVKRTSSKPTLAKKTSHIHSISAPAFDTDDPDLPSSSPAFETAKIVPKAKSTSAHEAVFPTIPPVQDSQLESSPSLPDDLDLGPHTKDDGVQIHKAQPQPEETEQEDPRPNAQTDVNSRYGSTPETIVKLVEKTVAKQSKRLEMTRHDSNGELSVSRDQQNAGGEEEAVSIKRVVGSLDLLTAPEVVAGSRKVFPLPQPENLRLTVENEAGTAVFNGERHLDKLTKSHLPCETVSRSDKELEVEIVIQNPKSASRVASRSPSVIPSSQLSQSPEPAGFLPPEFSSSVQFATAHFQSILKSPTKDMVAAKPAMPEITPEAELPVLRAKVELAPTRKITKPSPKSSPVFPEKSQQRPGLSTLEEAESTPVIRLIDIPSAPSSFIPRQPLPKARVLNPATTKGKGRSLSELAASTIHANEIETPSSAGAGSVNGLGFNVMPPPHVPAPQISRTTAAEGIGNNIAKRKYPTPPPPRVSTRTGQSEPTGAGWEGRVLVLGGKAGSGEARKENGVGVKDGPWCREAFDLFGDWVHPVG